MRSLILVIALVLSTGGLLLFASPSPATHLIMADVDIVEEEDCALVTVQFSFPVRYTNHFPYSEGDDLRIQLEPVVTSPADREVLFTRETVLPPPNEIAALTEVIYEGNIQGGPFLTLFFKRTVAFEVEQGSDYRSLVIAVTDPDRAGACSAEP